MAVLLPVVLRDWRGFSIREAELGDLRTVVVIDYQNVHLVGHGLYESTRNLPKHETLIDPLLFAQRLLFTRNKGQRAGMDAAVLTRVGVFSGHPSPEHDSEQYARRLAQKSHWERDRRVTVTLRPLKYEYARDETGQAIRDGSGQKLVIGAPREKGIDVLCALAALRLAREPDVDLVILASSDTDLAPVLDEVRRLGTAKIETFCWWDEKRRIGYQIHPSDRSRPIWNTRLSEAAFHDSRDLTWYQ